MRRSIVSNWCTRSPKFGGIKFFAEGAPSRGHRSLLRLRGIFYCTVRGLTRQVVLVQSWRRVWMDLDNTKLFTFWICKMKQLNLRHFNTNSNKFFETVNFFPERSKNGCKKADIILFSISRSFRPFCENLFQISQGYRRFSKLSKIS